MKPHPINLRSKFKAHKTPSVRKSSSRLSRAMEITGERVVRAYRLYLAGSAMSFERGWISLHQMLAARPSGQLDDGPMRGAQSVFPFQRAYMYR